MKNYYFKIELDGKIEVFNSHAGSLQGAKSKLAQALFADKFHEISEGDHDFLKNKKKQSK